MNTRHPKKFEISRRARQSTRVSSFLLTFPHIARFLIKHVILPLAIEKETDFNKKFRFSALMAGYAMADIPEIKAIKVLQKDMVAYIDDVLDTNSDRPVVWSEWNLSNEVLRAFDVRQYIPETLAVMAQIAGADAAVSVVEEAEIAGLPPEYCSAAKSAIGSLLIGESPDPDVIITSSHPCDSVASSYQALQYMTKAPMFVVDTPYWKNEDSFDYYANNLWDMIRFLEKHLNQKMDWDKFVQVCKNVNATNHYLQELSEMSRAVPSPTSVEALLLHWMVRMAAFGSPNGMEYAEIVHKAAKKRLKQKKSIIGEEKIRMIWYDVPVAFAPLYPWLEKEFGAVTVSDFIGRIQTVPIDTTSRKTIINGLARTHLYCSMVRHTHGPAEFYTEEFKRIIDEYSGDCFIFVGHQGCKGQWAILKLFRDICKKAGLPYLFIGTDIFDKRFISEEQIKKQFSDFFRSNGLA